MATRALTRGLPRSIGAVPSDTGLAFVDTQQGRVSLTLHRDFDGAESTWQKFQSDVPMTLAQSYACARLWHEKISAPEGHDVAIIAGRSDKGRLLFLWPMEIVPCKGLKALQWIGQDLNSYNLGLYDRDFAKSVSAADMHALLASAATMTGDVSLVRFRNQPFEWDGMRNPMAKLAHQPSPNKGYAILLDHDFETLYRNRFGGKTRNSLRRKERRLNDVGDVRYGWAEHTDERLDLLSAFFEQKAEWFTRHGIANPFADPGQRSFIETLSTLPAGTTGRLEGGYLKVEDTIGATYHGAPVGKRYHMLLSSIANGELGRWSPGILLMREQVRDICKQGYMRYDLGIGAARHKSEWCDEEIELFDSYIALDEIGYAVTLPMAAMTRAKRVIKNSPRLWSFVQFMRRSLPRRSGEVAPSAN